MGGCSKAAIVLLGIVGVCCVVGLIGSAIGSVVNKNNSSNNSSSNGDLFSDPTDTPAPQPIQAPVLGGTVDDFSQSYGQPGDTPDSSIFVWGRVTIAGHRLSLWVAESGSQFTQDGNPHIYLVLLKAPTGTTWNSAIQLQIMAAFLPPDATFVRKQNTRAGPERIYTSVDLAATFTSDVFTNNARTQAVPVGTLIEQCGNGVWPPSPSPNGAANVCGLQVGVF
jgi:hypothetical protein